VGFARFIASILSFVGYVFIAPSVNDLLAEINTFGGPVGFFIGLVPWVILVVLGFQVFVSFQRFRREKRAQSQGARIR